MSGAGNRRRRGAEAALIRSSDSPKQATTEVLYLVGMTVQISPASLLLAIWADNLTALR